MFERERVHTKTTLLATVSGCLQELEEFYRRSGLVDHGTMDASEVDLLAGAQHMMNMEEQNELAGLRLVRIASAVDDELQRAEIRRQVSDALAGRTGDVLNLAGLVAPTLVSLSISGQVDLTPEPIDIAVASLLIGRMASTSVL